MPAAMSQKALSVTDWFTITITITIGGVDAGGDVTKGAFSYRLVQCPVVGAGIGRLR